MRRLSIFLLLTGWVWSGFAQISYPKVPKSTNDATVIRKLEYPYHFKYEGNPLSRMHSATDPDVQVYDDEIWVYCGQDRNMDSTKHKHHYDAMDGYHVFSSNDMVNWTDYGEIFHSGDVPWAWEKGGFLWAPGSARKNGKYYLYYPIKDKAGKWHPNHRELRIITQLLSSKVNGIIFITLPLKIFQSIKNSRAELPASISFIAMRMEPSKW